jgi:two-component system response regulator AtoC
MKALIIDDEWQVREFVSVVLRTDGWDVSEAETAEQAFELIERESWPLVFCDVMLGSIDGFAVLRRFAEAQPNSKVVLMTGNGSAGGALEAVSSGAYDYLLKPFSTKQVRELAQTVRERQSPVAETGSLETNAGKSPQVCGMHLIGGSAGLVEVFKLIGRVAPTNLPVLVTGESGTGKELIARALHSKSRRASGKFVAVNCGAISSELIESELFGHARGSFTGADRDRAGLFEEANGGTVFLDEITETSPAFQVKLLRVLQEGEIRRVGVSRTQHVDVRVIAATNRDPEVEVASGRLRQDLFYRLNAVGLHLPPLRERREDILALASHFALQALEDNQGLRFSPEAASLLESYHWPGNIRELENVVVRAAALCDSVVRPADLPDRIRLQKLPADEADSSGAEAHANEEKRWPLLSEVEQEYVLRVLAHTNGNKQAASRLLGVDRRTIERITKRGELGSS